MARPDEITLQIRRVVDAPRSAVFSAFVDPATLARWWGPHGVTAVSVLMDAKAGGSYRIAMRPAEGEMFHLTGEFREVRPPSRLVYTFRWEPPDSEDVETTAVLGFDDLGSSTAINLTQKPFATERRRALHEVGWSESLDRLEALLSPAR